MVTSAGGEAFSSGVIHKKRETNVKSAVKKTIGECAEIIPGVLPHESMDRPGRYSYTAVLPKQLTADGLSGEFGIVLRDLPCMKEQFLQDGDVLIKRLNPDCASVFTGCVNQIVASANVFAIRPKEMLDSTFLAFLLEGSSLMQRISQRSGVGTAVSAITVQQIANCEIPLPPLELQHKLGMLWKLNKKEEKLLRELLTENGRRLRALYGTLSTK